MSDFAVPALLQRGTALTRISDIKVKQYNFKIDVDEGQIVWDSKKGDIIPIETIVELRSGPDTRYYRQLFKLGQDVEDRWITIIYIPDGTYQTVHLVAQTKDSFKLWDDTLRKLVAVRQELTSGMGNLELREAMWEKQYWKLANDRKDQKLDFESVKSLCRRLNVNSSDQQLMELFKKADANHQNYLDFTEFQRFIKSLKERPELKGLHDKLCSENGSLFDFTAFEKFMLSSQKSTLSQDELRVVFEKYATSTSPSAASQHDLVPKSANVSAPPAATLSAGPPTSAAPVPFSPTPSSPPQATPAPSKPASIMNLEGFTSFLLSSDNSVSYEDTVRHDMDRPLAEYYISCSHNTYLVGSQLVGNSTIEGYIRALLKGCRSVELDIYNGLKEPMVYHGKTLTMALSVRDICQAIARYAFVASPYPIIISAEIHCDVEQQDIMVEIMKEVFGDALIQAPIDGRPKFEVLPTPEELKGRILLKAKNLFVSSSKPLQGKDLTLGEASDSEESDTVDQIKQEWRKAKERKAEVVKDIKSELHKAEGHVLAHLLPSRSSSPKPPEPKKKVKMSMGLVGCLVYTVGVKCRGINHHEVYAPEHVFSLSENTMNKMLKDEDSMLALIKHTRTHLIRTYPKGTRFDSTNYEPHRFWAVGAQLTAVNWQTPDLGSMINRTMFHRNGRLGYVLKPLALRTEDGQLLSKKTKHFLGVTIISAQQLPIPRDADGHEIVDKHIIDPYVEVSIHVPDWTNNPFLPDNATSGAIYSPPSGPTETSGTSARTVTYHTSVVKNNGFNPVWQETLCLPFDCVGDMMELIFVRFAVKRDGHEHALAVYCASLSSLERGFRHLPLHDIQLSQYLYSTLFVQLDIQTVS